MADKPLIRKPAYVVVLELDVPALPQQVIEASAKALDIPISQLGQSGDASELVIRFDNIEDAVDLASEREGARIFRLGPQVWPR